jgi:translocation and assembly module TamB
MSRAARILAWTAGTLVAFLIVLVATVLVIGNTDSGRHLIERATAQLSSGQARIAGLSGSFPSSIELRELRLSDERGVWLTAEAISLRWSPLALLHWHVLIDQLHVARLDIERAPVSRAPSRSRGTPSVPSVDLHRLSIDTLTLGAELAGMPASLSVQGGAHLVSLRDASGSLVAHRTDGTGDYELQLAFDPEHMEARLALEEPAGGPLEHVLQLPGLGALSVRASLNGPRSAERIELDARAGELQGQAHGTLDLIHPAADLDYRLEAPAMSPRPGLAWQHVALDGRWHGPLTRPTADGHLSIEQLEVPGGFAIATLAASLRGGDGRLAAQAEAQGMRLPGPKPQLLADSPLRVDASLRLDAPERPLTLTANHPLFELTADARTAAHPSVHFALHLPNLAPLGALGGQDVSGEATVKGDLAIAASATNLELDTSVELTGGTALWTRLLARHAHLILSGDLSERRLEIKQLKLDGPTLALTADGSVERAPAGTPGEAFQAMRARWSLALRDLAELSPALAGTLNASGQLNGTPGSLATQLQATSSLSVHNSPRGTIQLRLQARGLPSKPSGELEAHGSLDDAPVRLAAELERSRSDEVRVRVTGLEWKSAHVRADFTAGTTLAETYGDLEMRMDRLADLQRVLGMSLDGNLAGSLSLRTGAGHERARLQLAAHNVVAGGVSGDAELRAAGTIDALRIELTAKSPDLHGVPASLTADGRLNYTARELRVNRAEASYQGQSLKLLSPAQLAFADGLAVTDVRLGAQKAVLELEGRLSPQLEVRASLHQVNAALINAFAPDLLSEGTVSAAAQLRGSLAAPSGHVELNVDGLRLANSALRDLAAIGLNAQAELNGSTAEVSGHVTTGTSAQLNVRGHAPLSADGTLDLKVNGKVDVGLANPFLEAHGEHASGALDVQGTVSGPVSAPAIGGTIHLTQGDLRDYVRGVHLADINASLEGEQGTLRLTSLTAHAAPGQLSASGTIGLLQPQLPLDLKITARNATPVASDILTANLDAELTVKGTLRERLDAAGTIHLNRTDIGIPNSLPPNVAVLDVRRKGQAPPPPAQSRLVIGLDIMLEAPRQIIVQGRGLNAELGGQIHIRGTTDEPAVSGGFEMIRGAFSLASTQLKFTNGRVSFNGTGLKNKIDPTLDFSAQSTVGDTTATLHITGFVDAPQFELSSTPPLPQDEILARLLFGESASQLSSLQLAQIGAALASLSGVGGGVNPLARLQKVLGLDQLSVGGGTGGNTSSSTSGTGGTGNNNSYATVQAGRYVTDRVFVAATQSTSGFTQLKVDVDIIKNLKVTTRIGTGGGTTQGTTPENDPGSSVGVSYQFEY